MIRNAGKVRQSLIKKGFMKEERAKHAYYIFSYKGREICSTFMSRNNQDIYDNLLSSMAIQLHLSRHDFIRLIDCPLSEEDYIKILKDNDLL